MARDSLGSGDFGSVPAPPMLANPYDLGASSGLISPYGLNIDPSVLKDESEFIFPTDSTGKRPWGERLLWSTGSCYMAGLGIGSLWGVGEGLARPQGSGKLRMNSILNSLTRRGPFLANNFAVVALMYRLMDSAVVKARGTDDSINKVACAVATGALFKSTAGKRAVLIGGGLGAAISLSSIIMAKAMTENWLPWMY